MNGKWRIVAVPLGIVSTVLLLAVLAIATGRNPVSAGSTPADRQEIVNLLTVKTVSVDCLKLVPTKAQKKVDKDILVSYDIAAPAKLARKGSHDPNHRIDNDAVSTPVMATEKTAQITEMQTAICRDPLLGSTWAYFFAHLKVYGVDVGDLNKSWLQEFISMKPDRINDKAMAYVPLLDVKDASTVTAAQADNARKQNRAYRQLAEYLGTLLGRFQVGDLTTATSVLNMDLVTDLVAHGLPEVQINSIQDNLPARHLLVSVKSVCGWVGDIAFNTGDKRPEQFGTPTCKPSPHSSGKPSRPSGCGKGKKNCPTPPGHPPTTKPPTTSCGCKTRASQAPKPDPKPTRTAPAQAPPTGRPTGNSGVAGTPTPGDTGSHSTPIPKPDPSF